MNMDIVLDGDAAWRQRLTTVLDCGEKVSPRGQQTLELLHHAPLQLQMARPVVMTPERKLNYRFMCAEALWILSGDNKLAPLTRFVKRMAEFSDDGETLYGAYGPPVTEQLPYVINALLKDRDTRQAVLTIWRQNPKSSKDTPCTIGMSFVIRDDMLHQHVFMRSSDVWLGIPYDIFSFSCIGLYVACQYNKLIDLDTEAIRPGILSISATSSHLYERNWEEAKKILNTPTPEPVEAVPDLVEMGNWGRIEKDLIAQRENQKPIFWSPRP